MNKAIAVTAAIVLLCLGTLAQADITIETVTVGDPGNVADITGYGAVGYTYNIGKYEVTAAQYTEFLNAKAKTDTYELYNIRMSETAWSGGIVRNGTPGSYTYTVASQLANRPINFVSFWDGCRFANWLSNGQGDGDTETGAYTLTGTDPATSTVTRNTGAKWALTSEDEWYKAAYYKGGSTNAGYWFYPTQTNSISYDMANYNRPYGGTVIVGSYTYSSTYGTFDQGGNVYEWNEAITRIDTANAYRGLRGGSFWNCSGVPVGSDLASSFRDDRYYPTYENSHIGFRISELAPVPEPSSLIALGALLTPLLAFRRRRV